MALLKGRGIFTAIKLPACRLNSMGTPYDNMWISINSNFLYRIPLNKRVNSRFETSYGFEKHNIRGIEKMKVRCGLSLCVMLSIAVGRIREGNLELIRSLVKTAA